MKEIKLHPDKIAQALIENLKNPDSYFVFFTDIVMNSWIEFLVTHSQESGTDALPCQRFLAWDDFKRQFLSAQKDGCNSVPSILRKFFVQDLISKNAALNQDQRFKSIIRPEDQYAKEASSFCDWICKNLPSLHFWKKRLEENKESYGPLDDEDKDYERLYNAYKDFLEKNKLFEPAWLDNINLSDKNIRFYIFYPELLEDFNDYLEILSKCENITIYSMPENFENVNAYFYPDSRSELRQTMLRIIQLVEEKKADWSEIALSIPNIETYRPYIEREFNLYQIPYVIKSGTSLTQNSAGRIFNEIKKCHSENFTFDSVRALVLDECLPWKAEYKEKRENLIRVGNEMRCICSPGEKDIWLQAFTKKINYLEKAFEGADSAHKEEIEKQIQNYSELKEFYQKIKSQVQGFFMEKSFKSIETAWQNFKGIFLDDDFSVEANAILGRCLTELKEIIKIDEAYSECKLQIDSPYDFFLQEISSKKYNPQQTEKTGVSIFAYKLSAAACFKYQFVIDGSQKNLEVPFKRLTFLNAVKRAKLHLVEDDKKVRASEAFIYLYAKKCQNTESDFVTFSAAEDTFADFAIPHSRLKILKTKNSNNKDVPLLPNLDQNDYIKKEMDFVLNPESGIPEKLTSRQKEEFFCWEQRFLNKETENYRVNDKIINNINKILIEKRNGKDILGKVVNDQKIKITARADLEKFFPCPRMWLLKSILKLHDDTLDTNLMQNYDMGNLNHKILELFVSDFKGAPLPFYDKESGKFKIIKKQEGVIGGTTEDFNLNLQDYIKRAIFAPSDFRDSPLVTQALESQKEKIENNMRSFLQYLLLPYRQVNTSKKIEMEGIGNCKPVGCEMTLCKEGENFDYYGKIDCLLLSPENDWIIIDYKSSKMPKISEINIDDNGILGDFQMPLYFKLVGEESVHEIGAAYFYSINERKRVKVIDKLSLSKEKDQEGKSVKDGQLELDSLYENFEGTTEGFNLYTDEFYKMTDPKTGSLNFTPYRANSQKDKLNVNPFEDCKSCSFKGICRTTFTIGGKTIEKRGRE